jgi:hypothetical protein
LTQKVINTRILYVYTERNLKITSLILAFLIEKHQQILKLVVKKAHCTILGNQCKFFISASEANRRAVQISLLSPGVNVTIGQSAHHIFHVLCGLFASCTQRAVPQSQRA